MYDSEIRRQGDFSQSITQNQDPEDTLIHENNSKSEVEAYPRPLARLSPLSLRHEHPHHGSIRLSSLRVHLG
jgi:hypothetical protein